LEEYSYLGNERGCIRLGKRFILGHKTGDYKRGTLVTDLGRYGKHSGKVEK
jgi:hypothetical protein